MSADSRSPEPSEPTHTDRRRGGLRERKKARTQLEIQTHALRLFAQHGYEATTVEQIIDAADISESTFYRYFPTKADLVLRDDLDPMFVAAIEGQPAHLTAVQAIRAGLHSVMTEFSAEQQSEQQQRMNLALSVPELRAKILAELASGIDLLAHAVGVRTKRPPGDAAAQALAGAVIGIAIAVILTIADDPTTDLATLLDESLAHLEAGFRGLSD